MSKILWATFFLAAAAWAQAPEAQISNGPITAKFYLPDAERGYYRGTRFDWSGVIYSLRTANHEYFGQWFPRYDPKLHDAIMGPVEEFKTRESGLGYDEAKAGETFIRIGVGVLRKPEDRPFQAFRTYEIVDPGRWDVDRKSDAITFTHTLKGPSGYAYRYTKTVRLVPGKPEMVIEHTLANTGTRTIETSQYNHNFFVIDGKPSGPESYVKFPFDLKAQRAMNAELAKVNGGEIVYLKELNQGQSVYGEFDGFGKSASDYEVVLENRAAGAGVRIKGDQPIAKLVFWSIRTTFCPEPYIELSAEPGREARWSYHYQFYDLPTAKP